MVFLLLPVISNSQPDYKYILFDFDTLFVLQNNDYLEMQGILKSYEYSDSISIPNGADVQSSFNKIYNEWIEIDSLIKRANELTFPNYSKDHQKISILFKMIDSATYNYKMNYQVIQSIYSKHSNIETRDSLKIRLDDISALRFPYFKPRYVK